MASCRIEFRRSAQKDLDRIDPQHLPRIIAAIQSLAENAMPAGHRKLVGGEHTYRIRVGDYRVVYEFVASQGVVMIARVRHRKEVYR